MFKKPATKINIAIDGYSGCGKSTLAIDLAECLRYIYLDSGAMYRAVTLFFQQTHWDYRNPQQLQSALSEISIRFERNHQSAILLLNDRDVSSEIRNMKVTAQVSEIAKISAIRKFLVAKQKKSAAKKGVIMEGRDIGTVVLPNAEYKLFLTADTEVRVERRFLQLQQMGQIVDRGEIRKNLEDRDRIDSTREDSPLKCAEDSLILDTSNMDTLEQRNFVLRDLEKKFPRISNFCL
nr:(d)CMP kinase [Saprospiraceae bacterium]